MTRHHPKNERMKRAYFDYLRDAMGRSEASIDAVAKALSEFDAEHSAEDVVSDRDCSLRIAIVNRVASEPNISIRPIRKPKRIPLREPPQ